MKYKQEQSLPESLKQHFDAVTLSTARLEQLDAVNNKGATYQRVFKRWLAVVKVALRHPFLKPLIPLAGIAVLVVALLPFIEKAQLPAIVSDEIAYNHGKAMALEVRSSALSDIAAYLSQLDFTLIATQVLDPKKWELLGGRYCSIQGQLAAQLKVRSRQDGSISTLYQALLPETMPLAPYKTTVDGVEVTLWQEQGLLLGLAAEKNVPKL